jgi:hypothetical protein
VWRFLLKSSSPAVGGNHLQGRYCFL